MLFRSSSAREEAVTHTHTHTHTHAQVSQYESLVEEASSAREEAVKHAAQLQQQMSDVANDLQV